MTNSSSVSHSSLRILSRSGGGIGRHPGFKILWDVSPVRVQVSLRAPYSLVYHYDQTKFLKLKKLLLYLKICKINLQNLYKYLKAGIVQNFEFTFELTWKSMQRFLKRKGVQSASPNQVIRSAFAEGLTDLFFIEYGAIEIKILTRVLSSDYDAKYKD